MTEQTIWVAQIGCLPVQVRVLWEDEAGMMVQPISVNDGPRFYADRDQIVQGKELEQCKREQVIARIRNALPHPFQHGKAVPLDKLQQVLAILESTE